MKKIFSIILSMAMLMALAVPAAAADPIHKYGNAGCRTHANHDTCYSKITWEQMSPYARARHENGTQIKNDTGRVFGSARTASADTTSYGGGKHGCIPVDDFVWTGCAYYGSDSARSAIVYGVEIDTGRTFITNDSLMQMSAVG